MALNMSSYVVHSHKELYKVRQCRGSEAVSPAVASTVVDCFGLIAGRDIKKVGRAVLTIATDVGRRYKALLAAGSRHPDPSVSFVLLHDAQQLSLHDGYGALAVA